MKKLMIVAAAAAISAGATAASLDAQAYDVTLTVKSTACREIKYSKTIAELEGVDYKDVKGDKIATRKQASTKIVGVIWGCDCETIANPKWRKYNGGKTVGGYLFWNPNASEVFNIRTTTFLWAVLNRIDNGQKAEGVWALVNSDAENTVGFMGAGFGKVKDPGDCRITLTSMSGSFAGFILGRGAANGCKLCGGDDDCNTWQLCVGCQNVVYPTDLAAAYGSWKIKYNKSVSKKLRSTGLITESYKFKSSSGAAETLMQKVEAAAAAGNLATDDDDNEFGFEYGEEIAAADVADIAYADADGNVPEVDEYDGDNVLVSVILSLAENAQDAS